MDLKETGCKFVTAGGAVGQARCARDGLGGGLGGGHDVVEGLTAHRKHGAPECNRHGGVDKTCGGAKRVERKAVGGALTRSHARDAAER